MVFQSFTCNCSFKPSPHRVRSYAEASCHYHYVQGSDITLRGWREVDSNDEDTFGPLLDDDKEELNEYRGNGLGLWALYMNILTPRADSRLADIRGSDRNAASVQKTLVRKPSKRIHLPDNLCQQILEFFYQNRSYEAYNRIKMIDDVERDI